MVGGRLQQTLLNGAIVYTGFGLLFGALDLGLLTLNVKAEGLITLAEFALALVLFTDSANANLLELKHSYRIPVKLLLIASLRTTNYNFVMTGALYGTRLFSKK